MFVPHVMALGASEVDSLQTSTVGWIVIAIAWCIIEALWLAGSVLTARTDDNSSKLPGLVTFSRLIASPSRVNTCIV
jgi:hypothetical protein